VSGVGGGGAGGSAGRVFVQRFWAHIGAGECLVDLHSVSLFFRFISCTAALRCTRLARRVHGRVRSSGLPSRYITLRYSLESESPLPGFVGGRGQKGGGAVTRRQGGGSAGCGGVDFARSACGSGDGARMGTEIDSVILCLGSSALIAFMSASASRGSPSRARPSTKPS
jgi:hypothetical protein